MLCSKHGARGYGCSDEQGAVAALETGADLGQDGVSRRHKAGRGGCEGHWYSLCECTALWQSLKGADENQLQSVTAV